MELLAFLTASKAQGRFQGLGCSHSLQSSVSYGTVPYPESCLPAFRPLGVSLYLQLPQLKSVRLLHHTPRAPAVPTASPSGSCLSLPGPCHHFPPSQPLHQPQSLEWPVFCVLYHLCTFRRVCSVWNVFSLLFIWINLFRSQFKVCFLG